jgi:hypothetical protein
VVSSSYLVFREVQDLDLGSLLHNVR